MANEVELPGADLTAPSMGVDLPALSTLDLPGPSGSLGNLDLPELTLDAPLEMPPAAPEPGEAAKAAQPAGKSQGKKKPAGKPKKPKTKMAAPKLPGLSSIPREAQLPVLLNLLNILFMLAIIAILPLLGIAINVVQDLTLDSYVIGLWLVIGCFISTALFNDVRTALIFTGIDLIMLITIFPTLWLLLGAPMSPMYFYVLGLIVLQAFVALPLNVTKSKKPAIKKAAPAKAGAPAPGSALTSPKTSS